MASPPSTPRVTVAVPSYNQGRFLEATLRSIFSQSVPMEVMIADAASTDDTLRVIERWQHRLTWFRTAPDKGQASAINEAISHARAPFVCWLNSDDIFLPGGLSTLVEAIEADPANAVAYGGCLRLDEHGQVAGSYRAGPVTAPRLSRRCMIPQPASIVRRAAWESVGGLNEKLHFAFDYDLWWRLQRAGARFGYIDVKVAAARLHPAAKSVRQAHKMYAEARSVVRRHHGSLPFIWWLKQPISIGIRKKGSVLQKVAHGLERWSGSRSHPAQIKANPPGTAARGKVGVP